ncbi:MAG: hypothetical protein AAF530_08445 [Pseudomonadota bacterium]
MMEVWAYYYAYGGDPAAAGLIEQPKDRDNDKPLRSYHWLTSGEPRRSQDKKRFMAIHNQPGSAAKPLALPPGI